MNKRQYGTQIEDLSCDFLKENGLLIKERNFRCKQGEVDIIAMEDGYLVFVEVKYRSSSSYGNAEEAVDFRKQRKICRVSDFYKLRYGLGEFTPIRFDVLAVNTEDEGKMTFHWIKDAFPYR